uniref:Ig-like domain-containing protein n=1 Tax=Astatotilapia calliptera TaxID=8154 RepID=A0A3P8NKE5_ASTCA
GLHYFIFLLSLNSDTVVPVKTVQLGEPATITCAIPKELSSRGVHWYKQSFGGTLKLIMTVFKSTEPTFGPEFTSLKFDIGDDFASLTILKADQDDEGIYHCANTERIGVKWSGTKHSEDIKLYNTMTLQCSVFSDSDNQTCPGGLNILWFRTGSNNAHPNIIYTDTNRSNDCEKSSDPQDRCVFQFSKNVSSSDAGTYYCAVATCGEILFGKGITLELGMIFYLKTGSSVYKIKADDELNYAALNFSERKTRGKRKREGAEHSVYSQVKR